MSTPIAIDETSLAGNTEAATEAVFGECPLPVFNHPQIVLGHGSGGKLSAELIENVFVRSFANPTLSSMNDSARLDIGNARLAFTTDSFVVTPIFFPGGDIGSLAVNGTVNDLAMVGAKPLYLSCAFILEEGLLTSDLTRVVASKVVNRGKGDQIFITTSGIGQVPADIELSATRCRPGDMILLSGFIGDHGITILSQREHLEFEGDLRSDCAALNGLVEAMLDEARAAGSASAVRCLRDPTRGGIASTLNEIASRAAVGMMLQEDEIPVRESVRGVCEILGLDPVYVANEGKLLAVVAPELAPRLLVRMQSHPLGRDSRIIGQILESPQDMVLMKTAIGGTRVVDTLFGEQLPRIC
jgi:hydrogenase expression/formation protein HypE